MATRYWFGGAGTWNAASTAHWAAASGITFTASCSGTALTTVGSPAIAVGMTVYAANGTSLGTITSGSGDSWVVSTGGTYASQTMGAQTLSTAPTSSDNVIFDTNSGTGIVSVTSSSATCTDLTVTASQSLSLLGTLSTCLGSVSLPSGGSVTTSSLSITFTATTTGKTITTNGKSLNTIAFNGAGGGWTLGSAITCGPMTLTAGTFNTGNFNITATSISSTGTGTRTLTLGSSSVTLSGTISAIDFSGSNLTLNSNTSTITLTASGTSFTGGGYTFYNVVFSPTTYSSNISISGSNTFTNLTLNSGSSSGYQQYSIGTGSDQTVTGTFTATGSAANNRVVVYNVSEIAITITAAAVSLTNVDFSFITGAGAATWTGTSVGNGGGNTNITFTSPKTVYWNLAGGGDWMSTTGWATTSSGTPAIANFPLPQDTATITNGGLNTSGVLTVSNKYAFLPAIDASSRTTAMSLTVSSSTKAFICNNITLSSSVTFSPATFDIVNNSTITSAGKSFGNVTIVNGTVSFADAFSSSGFLTVTGGTTTINAGVTATKFSLTGGSFAFGSNTVTLTGNNVAVVGITTSGTITGTPTFNLTYAGSTGTRLVINTKTTFFPNVNVSAGSDIVDLTYNGSGPIQAYVNNLNFTGFTGVWNTRSTVNLNGNLTLNSGMTNTTSGIIKPTSSVSHTFTSNGATLLASITCGGNMVFADNFATTGSMTCPGSGASAPQLNLNGVSVSCNYFNTSNTGNTLTFNGGTLLITGTNSSSGGFSAAASSLTTVAGTGTGKISMSGATQKPFIGNGTTFNCTLENSGAGALNISGNNTFTTISNSVQPATFWFPINGTTTVTNFNVSGTSGNLVTISTQFAGIKSTLTKPSGVVSVNYCSIKDSIATGGASWQAYTINGNVDSGGNTGWIFTASSGNGLLFGSNF